MAAEGPSTAVVYPPAPNAVAGPSKSSGKPNLLMSIAGVHPVEDDEDVECGCFPQGFAGGSKYILNEGSTARDFLARERNWLSWVKLSVSMFVISAALLLRFRFGDSAEYVPDFELDASGPLGILFFVAAACSLGVSVTNFFSGTSNYQKHKGIVLAGAAVHITTWSIAGLTFATAVLLLVASYATP